MDIIQRNNTNGQFTNGWSGHKICIRCNKDFLARSGVNKICDECKKCLWCGNYITGKNSSWKKTCNNSCASKWKYREYSQVRELIVKARKSPNRGIGISKYRKGRPRPDIAGEKNNNWRGGTSGERQKIMQSIPYKQWREAVFSRDDYTCQNCGIRGGKIQADHIKPFHLFPELRLDVDNGRTLCIPCHVKTDTYGHKVHSYLSK